MDEFRYLQKQDEQVLAYEALCQRCGVCCGASEGEPCSNLARDASNRYYCNVYDARLGV